MANKAIRYRVYPTTEQEVMFAYDAPIVDHTVNTSNAIGLDYVSDGLYTDHNGNKGSNHKFYRESHDKLAKAQRKLSRKVGNKKGAAKSNEKGVDYISLGYFSRG